jgi:general nucleoside transport system permease protein
VSLDFTAVGAISVISLDFMVPIALTAVGEIFAEKAGVVNIGLEGIMLTSAWFAVFVAWYSNNPYFGFLGGLVMGAAFGGLHSVLSVRLKGDQIISGVGINIFALGFVPFATFALWHVSGVFPQVSFSFGKVVEIQTPWAPLSYFVPGTVVIAVFFWFLLYRTRWGYQVRATGENPEAADAVGINVDRTRIIAVLVGSALAGLAGSYLSIDVVGQITKDISAGRGFIALATVVFSGWNPLVGLLGAVIFGYSQGAASWFSGVPEVRSAIPNADYLLNAIPFIVTLVVVAIALGRTRAPKAIGTPYKRE